MLAPAKVTGYIALMFRRDRSQIRGRTTAGRRLVSQAAAAANAGCVLLPRLTAVGAVLLLVLSLAGCRAKNAPPQPGSKQYLTFVSSFYVGLAGLQVGDDVRAEKSLAESTQLAPGEPSAWVNWGILALRQRNYTAAAERLEHAHTLAPNDGNIAYLLGLLESERGNSAAAIADWQQAVALDSHNLRALYQLASEIERQGDPDSDARFETLMQQILAIEPRNLAAQLELSRVAAKRGDLPALRSAVNAIANQSKPWLPEVTEQLTQLQAVVAGPQPRSAATRSIFLRNVLMRVPTFRDDLANLKPAPGEGAQPMSHFLRVVNPPSRPAPADVATHFDLEASRSSELWSWAGALLLNGDDAPVLAKASATHLQLATGQTLAFPGGNSSHAPYPESVLPIDFNYDFKTDLVLAGVGGLRFYRQDTPSGFTEVTASTKLPTGVLNGSYTGAWALDVEADGDLDILLGASAGEPLLLRNNGDGTFTPEHPFSGVSGLQQFTWVDLNGDGNPDAALLDGAGHLQIFLNRRSGSFERAEVPASLGLQKAIAAADVSNSDTLDLLAVEGEGRIVRLSTADAGLHWTPVDVVRVPSSVPVLAGDVRLYAEDLDNNGAVDLVLAPVSGNTAKPLIWLGSDHNTFDLLRDSPALAQVFSISDLKQDGHLALVGLTGDGETAIASARGTKDYHWQTIRPRAKQATGDQRVNSFGIGGEIEIRSGLLVQKQAIRTPALHFGLGEQKQTDVARILWPNGSVRAEFALKSDQQIVTEQRLKGSCPFLFAWNGREMQFVKDSVPWGSAIGLRINALGAAKIAATEEWYKIGRDQLAARDGFYDLRVTGELWESYYYDAMALMTVDHPAGTEVFADERFRVPAVKLAVTAVAPPQPVLRAVDDTGHDVTGILSALDGTYLDNFGRGQYQGVTRDHFVEITLPENLPSQGRLWLIAKGWLHPSDSSINVAISQGSADKPRWLSLEVPDTHGGWRVAKPNLGFPAGRNKICLFDLTGVFRPGEPHRLRLRTNLEVYWDQIQWAAGMPAAPMHLQRLAPTAADLHYRGFSVITQANASSPEIPHYDQIAGTSQRWRDLEGFYTRFGDVRELLSSADDRYVIMNAGDEMALRFAAPAPPPPGWVRDFVIVGDGWIKDGDYNSTDSQTVLPYPYHARRDYNTPPGALEEDWVYRHHTQDWQTYQTRYVTAKEFSSALRSNVRQ